MKDFDINGADSWSFPRGGAAGFGVKTVRTQDDWENLWRDGPPPGPLPEGAMAIVVSLGSRDYGPFSVGIRDVREEDDRLVVDFIRGGPTGIAMAAHFQPFAIKLVEASDKTIELNDVTPPPDHTRCLRPGAGPRF